MVSNETFETPLHILVIDGNEAARQTSVDIISHHGHSVDQASSCEEAIKMAYVVPYDLIFTELKLPTLDGFETASLIRTLPATRGLVPIIGLSNTQDPNDVRKCFQVGMSNFILKPLSSSKLMAIAKSYSQRKANFMPDYSSSKFRPLS